MIAMAIACKPQLLIADEPTTNGLDVVQKKKAFSKTFSISHGMMVYLPSLVVPGF
jgi:ABC-type dipeptide/oligopeptide/nickel transport system ATPase component